MYRLVIVDDEPDIVDRLYVLFSELEQPQLDVCRAYSAKEALDWLNRTRIDIVLTDIRMPGMSGLQMMEIIRDNWPHCKIIFLTGYNEFDYVYSAIKYPGVRYLLKTEGHEAIIEAVVGAVNDIKQDMVIDDLILNAKQQIDLAMPLLQKEYILDLIMYEVPDLEVRKVQIQEMGLSLNAEMPVILMLGRMDRPQTSMSPLERSKLIYSINLVVEKYLSPVARSIHAEYERFNILWIIQPNEPKDHAGKETENHSVWERAAMFVKGTLETIQDVCNESLNIPLSFVVDKECAVWEALPERFELLRKLLNYRFGTGMEMQLSSSDISLYSDNDSSLSYRGADEARALMKKIHAMESYLESGQKEHFISGLDEIGKYLNGINSMNYNPALELYYSISLMFLSYINRWNIAEKIAFKIGLGTLTRADQFKTWIEAAEYLKKLTKVIFDIQQNEEDKRALAAINKVQQYINENLHEDLSLVRLGELVHFNPSYLSRLFKQVTGVNLLSYINSVRLSKSKELLRDSNMKINEISASLGFISAPYFSRFFKKATNKSPQEYRDSSLNK